MKKIGLICAALLAGISLTACSNSASQKSNKKSSSSSVTTTKAVKHHNVHKESKKATQSSSSSAVSSQSNSQANQTSTQQSSQNGSQQSNSQSASQSNSNGLPPANDLHDFVNRYGESPAAYLAEHNGMSPEQAVQSVPDTMKTSGEIQDTYQIQQGQDPFN